MLSIRTPHATSSTRAKGFSQENVNQFFDVYELEFEKIKRQPHRIYIVDEIGICIVQHKLEKVISVKGKKEFAALTSAERGKLITVIICMNAVGSYIPQLIIWAKKKYEG